MSEKRTLRLPLDASTLEAIDREASEDRLRVVVRDALGGLHTTEVQLGENQRAEATVEVPADARDLRVSIGPADISAADLPRMRLPEHRVPAELLERPELELELPSFEIRPDLWKRWRQVCRTFVIEGQVLCPNGNPVPGAEVTAFDVDFWWWWSSWQPVDTAVTDAQGRYRMKFLWCCGFEPWWWWHLRSWRIDPVLSDLLTAELGSHIGDLRPERPTPDPRIFEKLTDRIDLSQLDPIFAPQPKSKRFGPKVEALERPFDVSLAPLEHLSKDLAARLPKLELAQRLRLWPWYPWRPWLDCAPDIVFQVRLDCETSGELVLDETLFETRWDISTHEPIDLVVATECCAVPDDLPPGDCVVPSAVCSVSVNAIGTLADGAQAGFANPSAGAAGGDARDRPFGGNITVSGTFGSIATPDVYTFEWRDLAGGGWNPLPVGSMRGFSRWFYGPALGAPVGSPSRIRSASFPVRTLSGLDVYETRRYFESRNDPGTWGIGDPRFWLGSNYSLLLNLSTQGFFADGQYAFRLVGYQVAGGELVQDSREIVTLCATEEDNQIVVALDNRFVGGASGHPSLPDHPCGSGTVHVCTLEPDTDILAIRLGGVAIDPCAIVELGDEPMEIDFLAHDPDGHLERYRLIATYGENLQIPLVDGATVVGVLQSLDAPQRPIGPGYGQARGQGAVAPQWTGGRYRLRIERPRDVFPETCGYQLELRAEKRTIVDCRGDRPHRNQSHFTVTLQR